MGDMGYPKFEVDLGEDPEGGDRGKVVFDLEQMMDDRGVLNGIGEMWLSLGLRLLIQASWRQAEANGWHSRDRTKMEELMLVVTEVAEGAEELRNGNPGASGLYFDSETGKPEGLASELGDVLIRAGDISGNPCEPVDLVEGTLAKLRYNPTRGYRHGGKAH